MEEVENPSRFSLWCWPKRHGETATKGPGALLKAAQEGNLGAVDKLLKKGANVNERSGEEDRACADATPLILATRAGHEKVVRRLLQESLLDINASTRNLDNGARSKQTALHWAAREGKVGPALAIAEDARLEVDARTQLGFTSLWVAAQSGQIEIMRALLAKNADAKAECFLGGKVRMTPVISSLIDSQPESLRVLIAEGGCDRNEVVRLQHVTHTLLGASAVTNWIGHVKVLLDLEADVNKEVDGTTPFDLAYKGHAVEIIMHLLLHGCDTSRVFSKVRNAQILGHIPTLTKLIKAKEVGPEDDVPELHIATLNDDVKALKAILAKLSDPHSARYTLDGGKMPALYYATELCHVKTGRILMMDVHGFSEEMVKVVIDAMNKKDHEYVRGERMFRAVMALFNTTASEERQYAKGAAAFLQPWMGSVPALEYFQTRHDEFHKLRSICHRRSEAIYEHIDREATVPVLEKLALIGKEYVDKSARQDDPNLLPKFLYFYDEKKGHSTAGDLEVYYAMDLALIAMAVDDVFNERMAEIFEPIVKKVRYAPPKTFNRMRNKLRNPNEHGDPTIPKPRPAKNVDVIRCGLEVSNPEDMQKVFDTLKSHFKVIRVKNSHDPHESGFGGYRSILVNFVFPIDATFLDIFGTGRFDPERGLEAGWLREDETAERWFQYVSSLPNNSDWQWSLSGLWHAGRSQPERKIVLSAEVQIIFTPYMVGRSLSHLLFKISRAETGPDEMVRDFAPGFRDIPPPSKEFMMAVKTKSMK